MKKFLLVLTALFVTGASAYATNMGDDFRAHYSANSNLSAYNRDLTATMGMIDFNTGNAKTFPAASLGVSLSVFKTSSNNDISSDSYVVQPYLVAETKIPVIDVGVVLRGTDLNGYKSIGGGLTYQMSVLDFLNLNFGGFYDRGSTEWYTNDHYSLSAVASAGILIFTPYLGVGYDYGTIKTRGFANNRSSSDGQLRGMVGLNMSPLPLLSGFVGYTVTKDSHGFTGGIGLSF